MDDWHSCTPEPKHCNCAHIAEANAVSNYKKTAQRNIHHNAAAAFPESLMEGSYTNQNNSHIISPALNITEELYTERSTGYKVTKRDIFRDSSKFLTN